LTILRRRLRALALALPFRPWRLLGLLAATRDRWAGAERHVEDALGISLSTVATHVRNILSSKTSSANRTEAAAYALRLGLVEREPAGTSKV
jgi:ATP/maltotriose-dependent transcriptional regulator MalT